VAGENGVAEGLLPCCKSVPKKHYHLGACKGEGVKGEKREVSKVKGCRLGSKQQHTKKKKENLE
jgi:hypothetical protein